MSKPNDGYCNSRAESGRRYTDVTAKELISRAELDDTLAAQVRAIEAGCRYGRHPCAAFDWQHV